MISFKIEQDRNMKVTIAELQGEGTLDIVLATSAGLGGQYKAVSAIAVLLVGLIVKPDFLTYVTQNLFLVKKYEDDDQVKKTLKNDQMQ